MEKFDSEKSQAVVTIGAPATADHLQNLFSDIKDEITHNSDAMMDIGGRKFKIKKQLLEDLSRHNTTTHHADLNKALLILHSPVDNIVSIDEAAKIYQSSRHPKSFISLDNADHLLTDEKDAHYVADLIASWASHYLAMGNSPASRQKHTEVAHGTVVIKEQNKRFTRKIYTDDHSLIGDEPPDAGGDNLGPDPYEFLLTALGTCTSMTIRMYANRKNIQLESIEVELTHKRIHAEDCHDCENHEGSVDVIDKTIKLSGDLSEANRVKLMEISEKCPVHKTLINEIVIHSKNSE